MTTTTTTAAPAVAHGLPGPVLPEARLAELRAALEECRRERRELLQSLTADDLQLAESDTTAGARVAAARRVLAEAGEALDRMDAGTYGRCVHCDAPIPPERLELLPHASGCVPCSRR